MSNSSAIVRTYRTKLSVMPRWSMMMMLTTIYRFVWINLDTNMFDPGDSDGDKARWRTMFHVLVQLLKYETCGYSPVTGSNWSQIFRKYFLPWVILTDGTVWRKGWEQGEICHRFMDIDLALQLPWQMLDNNGQFSSRNLIILPISVIIIIIIIASNPSTAFLFQIQHQ